MNDYRKQKKSVAKWNGPVLMVGAVLMLFIGLGQLADRPLPATFIDVVGVFFVPAIWGIGGLWMLRIRPAHDADWPVLCELYNDVRRRQFPWLDSRRFGTDDLRVDAAEVR